VTPTHAELGQDEAVKSLSKYLHQYFSTLLPLDQIPFKRFGAANPVGPDRKIAADMAFDLAPSSFEIIDRLLQAIGLLAALLLSFIISIPSAVSYDELLQADARRQPFQPM
jgi:hypothetical protein